MRVFDHPNMDGFVCPICGTSEDQPVVLVEMQGTGRGSIVQARQYHLNCISLRETKAGDAHILYMAFDWVGAK